MPGFEAAIVGVPEAGAMGVMCSYNMVNGKPTCGNPALTDTLRKDWGFDGYNTSDSDSCGDIWQTHKYAADGEHATAVCLAGGTDINSGGTYNKYLASGVASGVVPEPSARAALRNAYRFRMRLGLFDANTTSPNFDFGAEVVGAAAHRAASLDASKQSMVLLKVRGQWRRQLHGGGRGV
jgi:beta-glucosidase-like glycosyl hydrolase